MCAAWLIASATNASFGVGGGWERLQSKAGATHLHWMVHTPARAPWGQEPCQLQLQAAGSGGQSTLGHCRACLHSTQHHGSWSQQPDHGVNTKKTRNAEPTMTVFGFGCCAAALNLAVFFNRSSFLTCRSCWSNQVPDSGLAKHPRGLLLPQPLPLSSGVWHRAAIAAAAACCHCCCRRCQLCH